MLEELVRGRSSLGWARAENQSTSSSAAYGAHCAGNPTCHRALPGAEPRRIGDRLQAGSGLSASREGQGVLLVVKIVLEGARTGVGQAYSVAPPDEFPHVTTLMPATT